IRTFIIPSILARLARGEDIAPSTTLLLTSSLRCSHALCGLCPTAVLDVSALSGAIHARIRRFHADLYRRRGELKPVWAAPGELRWTSRVWSDRKFMEPAPISTVHQSPGRPIRR